jgi:mono/diheme cytochrome c family protein
MRMRCKNLIVGTLFLAVLTACGDPEPVSTGTRTPGLNRSTGNQQPATTPTTSGDVTKGQAALTASCTAVCHGPGKSAQVLDKADVGSIAGAATKSYHSTVKTVFETDGDNIRAYLQTL